VCGLGGHTPAVPSVAFLSPDGAWLIGEPADRRAASEPTRAAREFKRRVGDAASVLVGGSPFSADMLMARLLRWTADQVIAREGGPPDGLVVSHPANWGPYKQDLLRQAISLVDLGNATFVSEPEAAAIHYAGQERLAPGRVVAVYDLGGGTFDAAVLRRTETGWEILGEPQGIERLGGIDFDEAVFRKVLDGDAGAAVEALDPEDPATRAALARLRRECVSAKEALASDTAVSVPVVLPNFQADVRLMRSELEELLRPPLMDTIATLHQALRSAGVGADDLDAVLLVGGSSRLPLVAQIVGSELRRPVAIDVHPKHAVALGAATIAASRATLAAPAPATASGSVPVIAPTPTSGSASVAVPVSDSFPATAPDSGSVPATAPISGSIAATSPLPTGAPQPATPPAPVPPPVSAEQPTVSGESPAAPGPPTGTGPVEAPAWDPAGHGAATQHFASAPAGPGPASGSVDSTAPAPPAAPPGPALRSRQKLVAAVAAIALVGAVAAVLIANRGSGGASAEPGATTATTEASSTTTGSEMVAVPNLVGSTEQQARDLLSDAGLQLQLTGQPTTDPDEDGVILAQDPEPRTEVERRSSVRLTVGRLETTATTSDGSSEGSGDGGNGGGGGGGTPTTTTTTTTPTTTTTTPTTTTPTTTTPPQPTTTVL
jgi:actin-like ATPase involved in cell morphogenesis